MTKVKYKAPYDKRNEEDYAEITMRIENALIGIEKNPIIPATEEKLAEMAGCSRGTLRNRKHPLIKLKIIKDHRKNQKTKNSPLKDSGPDKNISADWESQLNLSRNEISVWFNKFKELESNYRRLSRNYDLARNEINRLISECKLKDDKIRELEKK